MLAAKWLANFLGRGGGGVAERGEGRRGRKGEGGTGARKRLHLHNVTGREKTAEREGKKERKQ